jgi:hypothetical protein
MQSKVTQYRERRVVAAQARGMKEEEMMIAMYIMRLGETVCVLDTFGVVLSELAAAAIRRVDQHLRPRSSVRDTEGEK